MTPREVNAKLGVFKSKHLGFLSDFRLAMSTTTSTPSDQLDAQFLQRMYYQMVSIRQFEEKVRELFERREIPGITHLSIGQEAVPVGICAVLDDDDYITSTHRGHGHCLAKGADLGRMFAELFGKVDGYCRGKGGSMHIANQDVGNLGANAIVGGSMAMATGAALSAQLRETEQVAVCFFGDGALNQGILLEVMNMASIWKLPVIYACENNAYGEYTATEKVTAGQIIKRGDAFGIPSFDVDGMDVIQVYEAAADAVARARRGDGPSFLVLETYRYFGHGINDVTRPYRTREEEDQWRQRDPIERLKAHLLDAGHVTSDQLDEIHSEIEQAMSAGVQFARDSDFPSLQEVAQHVYANENA